MKTRKLIGWLLLVTALFVISGICVGNPIYWSVIDILAIIVCSGSGFFLLRNKKEAE